MSKNPKKPAPVPPENLSGAVEGVRATIRQITAQWEICRFNLELVLPLMKDKEIIDGLNQTHAARALNMLVQTLATDVVKDCFKFGLDRSSRGYTVASFRTALDSLEDIGVRAKLRAEYSAVDPGILNKLRSEFPGEEGETLAANYIAREQADAEAHFDRLYAEVLSKSDDLVSSELAARFRTSRNKVIAHSEMVKIGGSLEPFDVTSIGLKYGDLEKFMECIEPIVAGLESLARSTDINVPDTQRVLKKYAEQFWNLTKLGIPHADRRVM